MHKIFSIFLVLAFVASLTACGTTTQTTSITTPEPVLEETLKATETPAIVTFTDPVLEGIVRGAMGRPEGDITVPEAEAVTTMNLTNSLENYLTEVTQIKELGGLEFFTNLESLDLSGQAITDISALRELTRLTALSLGGNPVSDITPLAGLTNLMVLILSNCQAQDYSALSNLTNLQVLLLDNSTLANLSPLAELTNLRQLYLANTLTDDYSPLEDIYPTLAKKDFMIPSTLVELGFNMDQIRHKAQFEGEDVSFYIHHSKWGPPPSDREKDNVEIALIVGDEYLLGVGFFVDQNTYEILLFKDGEALIDYFYDINSGLFTFGKGDQQSSEQTLHAALNFDEGEDVLLTPINIFNDTIKKEFHMTAEALYAMPFEPPTLISLGFVPNEANAVYLYEQREGRYITVEVPHPEWGEKDFDVRFYTPLSDEFRIVVTYDIDEKKYFVGADDNYGGGASFEYFSETNEHTDTWSSNNEITVEEYFINAYNDPEIEDIYLHSVGLMEQYINDTFGLTIEELYTLPTGE